MDAARIMSQQGGVVARCQAMKSGLTENDLRRMLRRRELVLIHKGVYVNHTGEPTWLQRAWAAVLFAGPDAALTHESALRAADGPGKGKDEVVHVAVGLERRVGSPPGVKVRRMAHLDKRVQWNRSPPRMRYEEAALDVAMEAHDELAALDVLASAVQSRRTTAARMLSSLDARQRSPRRAWLSGVLDDVAQGACSVLEHGYLTLVERAHDLPRAERQQRATATVGVIYRDAAYETTLVELDGRLFHDTFGQRDLDMDRDLDATVEGKETIRLGYGQVFARPCRTAARLAKVLRNRGWEGNARPCSRDCLVDGV